MTLFWKVADRFNTDCKAEAAVYIRPMSDAQQSRATLSRDKVARLTSQVAQLSSSRATNLLDRDRLDSSAICCFVAELWLLFALTCLGADQQRIFTEQNVKGVVVQLLINMLSSITEAMFVWRLFANGKSTVV